MSLHAHLLHGRQYNCLVWLQVKGVGLACAGCAAGGTGLKHCGCAQVVCEIGKAVGAEGLVAGQIVDIKSEGMADKVRHVYETRVVLSAEGRLLESG